MSQNPDSSLIIFVKVIANAQKNEFIGWENDKLKIKLCAQPEKGKANQALIEWLAKALGISKRHIKIVSGQTSPHKKISIDSLSKTQFTALIEKQFRNP